MAFRLRIQMYEADKRPKFVHGARYILAKGNAQQPHIIFAIGVCDLSVDTERLLVNGATIENSEYDYIGLLAPANAVL